jgi:hypothetical protein
MLQGSICPILKQEFSVDTMVVDHKHKRKFDVIGTNDAGIIRGVIHNQVNVFEAKVMSAFIRCGLHKFIEISDLLHNLADFYDKPPLVHLGMVHPSEVKRKKLTKRSYNKLRTAYNKNKIRKRLPNYPKSGILTVVLKEFFIKYEIVPEFYK